MEDRLTVPSRRRPGAALAALVVILCITAAWWALALWPAASATPGWIIRFRSVCFGAEANGLPDAVGWALLLGEPAGMIGILLVLWGGAVRRDLRWVAAHRAWRLVAAILVILALAAFSVLVVRVVRVWISSRADYTDTGSVVHRVNRNLPPLQLVDQDGRALVPADLRGRTTLVTFLFGHCTSVCPLTVQELQAARRESGRRDVHIMVITLDPWRDTPERLPSLAAHWGLSPQDRALSGNVADVEQALDSLGVARSRNTMTGDMDHVTAVLMLDPEGRIAWRVEGSARRVAGLLARSP